MKRLLPLLAAWSLAALPACAHRDTGTSQVKFAGGADVVGNGIYPPAQPYETCQTSQDGLSVEVFQFKDQNGQYADDSTFDVVMTDATSSPPLKTHFEAMQDKTDPSRLLGTKYPNSSLSPAGLIVGGGAPIDVSCAPAPAGG